MSRNSYHGKLTVFEDVQHTSKCDWFVPFRVADIFIQTCLDESLLFATQPLDLLGEVRNCEVDDERHYNGEQALYKSLSELTTCTNNAEPTEDEYPPPPLIAS